MALRLIVTWFGTKPLRCVLTSSPDLVFQPLDQRDVIGRFDGGTIPSDGGCLLLGEAERLTGTLRQLTACFTDHRDADAIEHPVGALVAQRIYGLALGYEDLNGHDRLRLDPLLATLVGKGDPSEGPPYPPARPRQGPGRQEYPQPPGTDATQRHRGQPLSEDRCPP
jgi:hypothetical protein